MTAIEDARAALADLRAGIPQRGDYPEYDREHEDLDKIDALIAEHERLIAATNPRKTIAQISAYEAAVSIRAREIVDTRKVFEAVATPPTDDEREALALHIAGWEAGAPFETADEAIRDGQNMTWLRGVANSALVWMDRRGFRRQGPPTDANPQAWQYGVLGGFPERVMGPMSSRASAENLCGDDLARLMRRRPGVAPGPWEPVEADAD